jgi:hypothetical protein
MTDSVQLKLRQRANIMLKVCELAESYRPEADKAMIARRAERVYVLLTSGLISKAL